jgi:hypothetical protein
MSILAARSAPLTLLLAASCGGPAAPPVPDAAAATDGGSTAELGGFVVSLVPAASGSGSPRPAYTSVLGKVYGGAVPAATVWTVIEEGGGCRLLTPSVPFCSAACGSSATCVEGGSCAANPKAQDLGRVHVEGLGAAFDMDPIAGNYQPAAGLALPYPPFAEGGLVRVTAPGGALGPFSIEASGIAPLGFEQTVALATDQPLRLAWTPPGQPELSRIEVLVDISHHGGARGKIECAVADTGTLEIPASQVTRLVGLGVAGFPTIVVTRVATGTAAVPAGIIALRLASAVERAVEIEGLRSCTESSQCPAGKTCRSDLTCQ